MNVQFDKEKALNALLYVTNRVQRKDFHKIFKIIYFADRQHLADWGRPITGDTYIAREAGLDSEELECVNEFSRLEASAAAYHRQRQLDCRRDEHLFWKEVIF